MTLLLYNIFCRLYALGIAVASRFNSKAAKWVSGRKGWQRFLQDSIDKNQRYVWVHCSSLGEFEQGRPFMEHIKNNFSEYKILLTFFSPSGYEVQKNYSGADVVMYLPMDSAANAAAFINIARPVLAVFVKYEFWYHYLTTLHQQEIPTILISGAFRKEQAFFKWYGGFFRRMLDCFDLLFVQDEACAQLLHTQIDSTKIVVAGDTRYDRVGAIADKIKTIEKAEWFRGASKLLVAGSTWPDDEQLLRQCLDTLPADWKMLVAPHEIDEAHIARIIGQFGEAGIRYTQVTQPSDVADRRVLVVDNIGMLSSLYAYGTVAYIGGGFARGGIHNILEPAVFGLPVIFGPVYQKFVEANVFVANGFAVSVKDSETCIIALKHLVEDAQYRGHLSGEIKLFMQANIGATNKIMDRVVRNGWLIAS